MTGEIVKNKMANYEKSVMVMPYEWGDIWTHKVLKKVKNSELLWPNQEVQGACQLKTIFKLCYTV